MYSRSTRMGISKPPMESMDSSLVSVSLALLACKVVMEPSWPVFIACIMSNVSAPRHSPTMIRSGRMRSALRRSSLVSMAPTPSTFAARDSKRTMWPPSSRSSAASSMVITRSVVGMATEAALSIVVFPTPVPPEKITFSRPATMARSRSAVALVSVPILTSPCNPSAIFGKRRMLSWAPSTASGGIIALMREPSDRRVSTIGLSSSMRRPVLRTKR